MPIRVLATFPEIPSEITSEIPRGLPVSDDHPGANAAAVRADASELDAATPADAPVPLTRPVVSPAARRPRRIRPRAAFPGASVAALAVVAAAVWSLIAIREAKQPAADERGVRIATETAGADAAGAILR
jgi:hypothetical protein